MSLRIGIQVDGQAQLAKLKKELKDLGVAAEEVATAFGKGSIQYKQVTANQTSMVRQLKVLEIATKGASRAAEHMFATFNRVSKLTSPFALSGSGAHSLQGPIFKTAIKDLNLYKEGLKLAAVEAKHARSSFMGLVSGTGAANKAISSATGITYRFVTALEAEAVAAAKLGGLHTQHVAALAQLKLAEEGTLGAMKKKIGYVEAETAALLKLQAARVALAPGVSYQKQLSAHQYLKDEAAAWKQHAVWLGRNSKATSKMIKGNRALLNSNTALGSSIRGVAGAMGSLWMSYGQIIPMMAAFTAASTVVKGFKEAFEFDYLVTYAGAIQNTAGSIGDMKDQLLEIKGVTHGPAALAEGLTTLARAGEDVQEVIDSGLMKTYSHFAEVAQMNLNEGIQLTVTQLKAFAKEGLEAKEAMNIMTAAAMNAPIDFKDLQQSLKHTTELAGLANQSFLDVNTAIVLMGKQGIRGGIAGRAIRTSLLKMLNPASDLRKKMAELGVSLEVFDEQGRVKDIKSMFLALKDVTDAMNPEDATIFVNQLMGLRSLKAGVKFLSAVDSGEWEKVNKLLAESQEGIGMVERAFLILGDAARMAAKEMAAAFQREIVKEFKDSVEGLTPVFKALADNMEFIVPMLANFVKVLIPLIAFKGSVALASWITGIGGAAALATISVVSLTGAVTALLAFVAGWSIGKLIDKKYIAMAESNAWWAEMLKQSWIDLKNLWKEYSLFMENVWAVMLDNMLEMLADFVILVKDIFIEIASIEIKVPDFIKKHLGIEKDSFRLGLDSESLKIFDATAEKLRNISMATKEYTEAKDKLIEKTKLERAVSHASYLEQLDDIRARGAVTLKDDKKRVPPYIPLFGDPDIDKLNEDSEAAKQKVKELADEARAAVKRLAEALKIAAEITEKVREGYKLSQMSEYDKELYQRNKTLEETSKALLKVGGRNAAYNETMAKQTYLLYNSKEALEALTKAYIISARESESFFAGISAGFVDIVLNMKSLGEMGFETAKDIRGALGDTLKAGLKGDWEGIEDIWQGVLDKLTDRGIDWAVDMAIAMGTNLLTNFTKSLTSGSGNIFGALSAGIGKIFSGEWGGALSAVSKAFSGSGGQACIRICDGGGLMNAANEMVDAAETLKAGATALGAGAGKLGSTAASIGKYFGSPITSGGALSSVGNAAMYVQAMSKAFTSGLGTAASWYAGIQASQMGVNAGTQLALIEGTYGPMSEAVTTGVKAGMTAATTTSAISSATTAGAQAIIAQEGIGWAPAVAAQQGAVGAAGVGAMAGAAMVAGFFVLPMMKSLGLFDDGTSLFVETIRSLSGGVLQFSIVAENAEQAAAKMADPSFVKTYLDAIQQSGSGFFGNYVNTKDSGRVRIGDLDDPMYANIAGAFKASLADSVDYMQTEYGPEVYGALKELAASLGGMLADVYTSLEIEAERYGDTMAILALGMADSVEAFDAFVDASAGYDVAMEDSAALMDMASAAAYGNADAYQQLVTSLQAMGMSYEGAASAANQMMAVLHDSTFSFDAIADGFSDSMETIQSAAAGNQDAYQSLIDSQMAMGSSAEDAAAAVGELMDSLGKAEGQFNSTEFKLQAKAAIEVEVTGAAKAQAQADADAQIYHGLGYAGGGLLEGGSGIVDDLYLGMVNGKHIVAKGGEFIMNPKATRKYMAQLHAMNTETFAGGGVVDYTSGPTTDMEEWSEKSIRALEGYFKKFNQVLADTPLKEYTKDMFDIGEKYKEIIAEMKRMGSNEEDIAKAQEAQQAEYAARRKKRVDQEADYMEQFYDVLKTQDMSDYKKQVYELNKEYDVSTKRAKELNMSQKALNVIEAARAVELEALAEAQKKVTEAEKKAAEEAITDFMSSYEDIIATSGMSDYEKQVYELSKKYEESTKQAKELNVSQEDLSVIEAARILELEALANATEGAFTNLADVLKEIEDYGLQRSVTGSNTVGHTAGGITNTTHVWGESGWEGIFPLRHPKQVDHIEDKLDGILNSVGSGNIQVNVFIGNDELDARMEIIADDVATRRQDSNVQGRMIFRELN